MVSISLRLSVRDLIRTPEIRSSVLWIGLVQRVVMHAQIPTVFLLRDVPAETVQSW